MRERLTTEECEELIKCVTGIDDATNMCSTCGDAKRYKQQIDQLLEAVKYLRKNNDPNCDCKQCKHFRELINRMEATK